jgi:hypothetical protein
MDDQKVIETFHMMWGSFPVPVRLIHKSRKVLAVNETARNLGMDAGVQCFSIGNPEAHRGCKANEALALNQGQILKGEQDIIKFWSPVRDCEDVYVHFQISVDSIKYVRDRAQ